MGQEDVTPRGVPVGNSLEDRQMLCEVHGSGRLATASVTEHVVARLEAAIGRFGDRVARVRVRLDDVNGPRGGPDKQCTLDIALVRGGHLIIRELRDDLYAAISVAADRAKAVVARRLDRRKAA